MPTKFLPSDYHFGEEGKVPLSIVLAILDPELITYSIRSFSGSISRSAKLPFLICIRNVFRLEITFQRFDCTFTYGLSLCHTEKQNRC